MPHHEYIKLGQTPLEMEDRNAYPVRSSTHPFDRSNIVKNLERDRAMERVLNLIPKFLAVAIVAAIAWLVYTNMQPTTSPEENAAQETEETSAETPWVSGYSLIEKNNTMVIPRKKTETTTKEESE